MHNGVRCSCTEDAGETETTFKDGEDASRNAATYRDRGSVGVGDFYRNIPDTLFYFKICNKNTEDIPFHSLPRMCTWTLHRKTLSLEIINERDNILTQSCKYASLQSWSTCCMIT